MRIYSSAINQLFCAIYVGDKIFVSESFLLYEIDFAVEETFEAVAQVEVIGHIVECVVVEITESYEKVDIALVIEPVGEYRAEDSQCLDPVSTTQVEDMLEVELDEVHIAVI